MLMPVPRPSAYSLPMIGMAPKGLTRLKVTSSPMPLPKSMQRTIGRCLLVCFLMVATAPASPLGMEPIRRDSLLLRLR